MTGTTSFTVDAQRRLPGSPDDAFAYFTDPAKHVVWQGVAADLDPRPGGRYVVHFNDRSRVRGEYVVVDRPRRIVLRWGWESDTQFPLAAREVPPGSTTVEVTFEADGDATIVRVRHTALPSGNARTFTFDGWTLFLDRLQSVASGANPGPDPVGAYLDAQEAP